MEAIQPISKVLDRLLIAEQELLELTLRGALEALCDTFAMVSPTMFGAALRVKRLSRDIAARVDGVELWQVEVAAMLCDLGAMSLPAEREPLARVTAISDQLLATIPRLDAVREIVRHCRSDRRMVYPIPRAAHVMRVALDFDDLETAGLTSRDAIARMRGAVELYEPDVLDALGCALREPG